MANLPSRAPVREEIRQALTFRVGEETYAISLLRVREIVEYQTVTRVPTAPPWIRGVTNLRGSVVPVLDLAAKLGLAASPVARRTCIVLVELALNHEEIVLGLVVDAVDQVIDLTPEDVAPPPAFGTPVHTDYLLGMAKLEGRLALLLDIDQVLTADELLRAEAAAETTGEAEAVKAEAAEPAPAAVEEAV
jgi:purine-binding chemotaxis protein CheW